MRFLSIYKNVERNAPPSQEEIAKMGKLIEEGVRAGELLSVEGCMPSATGARMRLHSGKLSVTDGPFTETREVIGGFAIIRANSKQHALEIVKKFLLIAGEGECELRQVFESPQVPCAQSSAAS
jgi:hypothetical protein